MFVEKISREAGTKMNNQTEKDLEKLEKESKNISEIFDLIDELILHQRKLKQQLSKVRPVIDKL